MVYEVYTTDTLSSSSVTTAGQYWPSTSNNWSYWTYPTTKYLYQLMCPVKSCKTMNWAELDTIVPCKNCGASLKAVSKKAEYEIEVG